MARKTVAIVGAGFTGVAAAHALQQTHDVQLLEASSRLGGRVWVEPQGDGVGVDRGGQFMGVAHKRLMRLTEELGLADQRMDYVPGFGPDPVSICDLAGRRVVTRRSETYFGIQGLDARAPWGEQGRMLLALARVSMLCMRVSARNPGATALGRRLDRVTYADFVARYNLPAWFADLMYSGVRGVWSQHPEEMSLLYVLWYMKTNGGFSSIFNDQIDGPQQFGLRCGMGHLLETWAGRLRCDVRLEHPVTRIDIGDDACVVHCAGADEALTADAVIVAVTPGVTGRIEIDPPLPAAWEVVHRQPQGFAVKSVVLYDEPWWRRREGPEDHIFAWLNGRGSHGVDWILDASAEDGSCYALCAFVSPELVDATEPAELDRVIVEHIGKLAQDERATHPRRVVTTDWRAVPWVEGGPNTNFGPGVLTAVAPYWNRPHHERLFLAAAEYAEQFCGYIEGAIASGRDAARQIQRAFPGSDRP